MFETLAYTLVQCLEVSIMVHYLAIVHGDVLIQVLGFQFGMSLTVDTGLLRDFATIQLPKVATDSFGEYLANADLIL